MRKKKKEMHLLSSNIYSFWFTCKIELTDVMRSDCDYRIS